MKGRNHADGNRAVITDPNKGIRWILLRRSSGLRDCRSLEIEREQHAPAKRNGRSQETSAAGVRIRTTSAARMSSLLHARRSAACFTAVRIRT
jgi:hypothetical protein